MVRPAAERDTALVSEILHEAAQWLIDSGKAMWKDDELSAARIAADVRTGLYFVAEREGEAAGIVRFQLEDPIFWPDVPEGEAAYIHRLAVRRRFAGVGVPQELMNWAAERTRSIGRRLLRLDCEAEREKLRAMYQRFGFRHHSDRQVGPYFVARYEYEVDDQPTH